MCVYYCGQLYGGRDIAMKSPVTPNEGREIIGKAKLYQIILG